MFPGTSDFPGEIRMTPGITVDQDLCTKCSICSTVCPMGLISPADETTLPALPKGKEPICIGCGHCEADCPSGALALKGEEPGEGGTADTRRIETRLPRDVP